MKVEFITQPFLKYTSMKNDRRSSKNAILLLFRVFLRFFFCCVRTITFVVVQIASIGV